MASKNVIQVVVSDETIKKIEFLSNCMKRSKSNTANYIIEQWLDEYERDEQWFREEVEDIRKKLNSKD